MKEFNVRKFLTGWLVVASVASSSCASGEPSGKERLAKAEAMMAERCKMSGEKIYRTVDHVDGIYLLKIRPKARNFRDQFKLDDPYGADVGEIGYIKSFLRGEHHQDGKPRAEGAPPMVGYHYVDAIDDADGNRYRYTGHINVETKPVAKEFGGDGTRTFTVTDFVSERTLAVDPAPRYGVTYDDISTREEREYWIAGSSLKVIDLQTNEVIGERVGYMMDTGQGSSAGARSPWLEAADYACPGFQFNPLRPLSKQHGGGSSAQAGQTLIFVEKVLHPNN